MTTSSDNFNRPSNTDLGAAWDIYAGLTGCQIVNNIEVAASGVNATSEEYYNAFVPGNDQFAQVTITAFASAVYEDIGVGMRSDIPANGRFFYQALAELNNGTQTSELIVRSSGGTVTLSTDINNPWSVSDVLAITANSTTISVYRNGSIISPLTVTDSTLTAGGGSIRIKNSTGGNLEDVKLDNFTVGDYADWVGAPTTPAINTQWNGVIQRI